MRWIVAVAVVFVLGGCTQLERGVTHRAAAEGRPPRRQEDFTVLPPDPHGFDGDGDGTGCESR